MAKQFRTFTGLFIILVVLSVFIFSAVQGSGAVYGHKEPDYTYFPLVLSGCTNAIPFQPPSDLEVELETLAALNQQRALNGISSLAMNESLVQIARYHSMDMAVSGEVSHTGSEGESPWARYVWLCETFAAKGEIIGAISTGSVETMVDLWMKSDDHRPLILDPEYTLAGFGYIYLPDSEYKHYWTVNFGSK